MLDKTLNTHIVLRNDTSENWKTSNPILLKGEAGYETDTRKLKFGDGITAYNDLPYTIDADSGGGGTELNDAETYTLENLRVMNIQAESGNTGSVLFYNAGTYNTELPLPILFGIESDLQSSMQIAFYLNGTSKQINEITESDLANIIPLGRLYEHYGTREEWKVGFCNDDSGYFNGCVTGNKNSVSLYYDNPYQQRYIKLTGSTEKGEITTNCEEGSLNDKITWNETDVELKGNTRIHNALITERGSTLDLTSNITTITNETLTIEDNQTGIMPIEIEGTSFIVVSVEDMTGVNNGLFANVGGGKNIHILNKTGSTVTGVKVSLLRIG